MHGDATRDEARSSSSDVSKRVRNVCVFLRIEVEIHLRNAALCVMFGLMW